MRRPLVQEDGYTPLHTVARRGFTDLVDMLYYAALCGMLQWPREQGVQVAVAGGNAVESFGRYVSALDCCVRRLRRCTAGPDLRWDAAGRGQDSVFVQGAVHGNSLPSGENPPSAAHSGRREDALEVGQRSCLILARAVAIPPR